MAKTKFVDNVTVLRSSFNNTIYGGLEGTPEGAGLPATDPLIGGHVHDGTSEDGHAQKINLADHVTGELDGQMLQDNSVPNSKLIGPLGGGGLQEEQRVPFGQEELAVFDLGSGAVETVTIGPVSEDTILKEIYIRALDPSFLFQYQKYIHITEIRIGDGETFGPNLMAGIMPSTVLDPRFSQIFPATFNEVVSAGSSVQLSFLKTAPLASPDPGGFPVYGFAMGVPGSSDAGLTKNTFLGCDTVFPLASQVGAVKSSNTITINVPNLTAGDTIEFNFPFQGIETLTGVTGARTSGDDDFQVDLGSSSALATEIAAAINDAANSFSDWIEATPSGSDVTIEYQDPGEFGDLVDIDITTSGGGDISLPFPTRLNGGVPGTITLQFTAFADMKLKKLFTAMGQVGSSSSDKGLASTLAGNDSLLEITSITVNGGANLIDGRIPTAATNNSQQAAFGALGLIGYHNFDLEVSVESTVEVQMINNFNLPATSPIMVAGWLVELT